MWFSLFTVVKMLWTQKGAQLSKPHFTKIKPHFDLLFTTTSTSKNMFFSGRKLKKALCDTLTQAALSKLLLTTAN